MDQRTCDTCEAAVTPERGGSRYCSDECRYRMRDQRRRLPCEVCGDPTGWSRSVRESAVHPGCKPWRHGTRKGYREHNCRCDECRAWSAESIRKYRERYQAENGVSLSRKYRNRGDNNAYISRADREAIYERDGWVCQLCGGDVPQDVAPNHKMAPTLDHIECRSWALIPDHSPENLRLAHRACNARRRDGRAA